MKNPFAHKAKCIVLLIITTALLSALLLFSGCQNNYNDDKIQEYTVSMTKPFQDASQNNSNTE